MDEWHRQGSCERRQLLLTGASLLSMGAWGASLAEQASAAAEAGVEGIPTVFEDTSDKFTISVPKGWASGQGEISGAVAGPTGGDLPKGFSIQQEISYGISLRITPFAFPSNSVKPSPYPSLPRGQAHHRLLPGRSLRP